MHTELDELTKTLYGTAEVEDLTGISAFTIRYYDKCGFFPALVRNKRGVRYFSHADIERLQLVDALRRSGLSIEGIQYFVKISEKPSKQDEVKRILETQKTMLEIQRDEIEHGLERIQEAIDRL